jgi:hypothetical protein
MSSTGWTLSIIAWFLTISAAGAQESAAPDPLFQSNEVLEVRLTAPMETLLTERPFEEELPGKLQYTDAAGQAIELNINVRTRGKFRRDQANCLFPPLRLNFKKSETKDTLFHKQNKVKLVSHCQVKFDYQQGLLREYVAYRILNVMTDISFRVRLLKITYADSDNKRPDETRYAFIIEHRDRLAKRHGKTVLDVPRINSKYLNHEYMNLISVYHYLIGNTDFSQIRGAEGERCCHNHVLLGNEGEKTWSVPYDFDQSGLVDAPYALAAPRFRLRSVRQRLYRGRCYNNEILQQTIAAYQDKREEILATVSEVDMANNRARKDMTDYIEKFYKTLDSERRVNGELIKRCI